MPAGFRLSIWAAPFSSDWRSITQLWSTRYDHKPPVWVVRAWLSPNVFLWLALQVVEQGPGQYYCEYDGTTLSSMVRCLCT